MKKPEEAIEKVLAGLRGPDAPDGMERRILAALEDRASGQSRSGWRRWRPMWLVAPVRPAVRPMAWGVALAGVFVVAVTIPAIRRFGHVPGPSKMISAPVVASVPPAAPEMAARSAQLSLPRAAVRLMKTASPEGKVSARGAGVVSESDSLAVDEMHAASHPAPPMPLTEQERLLLRIAHKTEPIELAMLDPKLQAAQDSEERVEFQRFFGGSTVPAKAAQTVAEQAAPQQSTAAPQQSTPEQATPAQPITNPSTPEQVQEQTTPEQLAPDPSTTPQPTQKQ